MVNAIKVHLKSKLRKEEESSLKDMYTCTEFFLNLEIITVPLMTYFLYSWNSIFIKFQFIQCAIYISFEKWKMDRCRQEWFILYHMLKKALIYNVQVN